MLQPKPAQLPEATATGLLTKKPIAHLLVYALDRKLSGTFELTEESRQRTQIVVADGLVARVSTTESVIYLGHVLYESGVIDGGQLSASLADVATTKQLHGQILLERKMLDPRQLADGLRQQRSRKLHHAFGLPGRTTFAFYSGVDLVGERPNDVEPMAPLPSIWRGIRAHPSWDHVRSTIATVNGRRLRLVGDVEELGLEQKERTVADRLRRNPSTVAGLASPAGLDARAAELLAYFLVITKLAVFAERVGVPETPLDARPTQRNALGAALSSGEYVRKISFTMRAVGGDARALRIPSPMPGRLAAVQADYGAEIPVAHDSSPDAVRRDTLEAEHSLSQAEMHFVLGERDQALGFARKAFADAPEMPEAMAFLAYLEALGSTEDAFLRDLLKMIDTAVAKDDTCRRGRFYRAEIKKRLEDHHGAIRDLRVAVTNDPDDADAQRELRAYEQKVRDGTIELRSMSPFGGTPKPSGLMDRLRGK
jgi:tetratricopeptide (TPR) repeat protein